MLTKDPKDDGIVLTDEMMSQAEKKLKPHELPNPAVIAETVADILEYMNTDEIIKIQKDNMAEYENILEKKFQSFATKYRSIFSLVISGNNLEMLIKMLESLEQIKEGHIEMEKVEIELRDELAETYIFSKLNDKEKKKMKKKLGINK